MHIHYNHNEHYADLLARQAPAHCQFALDIGCGDGSFVRRLARQSSGVIVGMDMDQATLARAQAQTSDPRIEFVEADFMQYDFAGQRFDFIAATASLHHMPFVPALEKMGELLRPGGVLAVLGLFREATFVDRVMSVSAMPANAFYANRRGWKYGGAPIKPVTMTLREIREGAPAILPAAQVRRLLLWRYLLTWRKP